MPNHLYDVWFESAHRYLDEHFYLAAPNPAQAIRQAKAQATCVPDDARWHVCRMAEREEKEPIEL